MTEPFVKRLQEAVERRRRPPKGKGAAPVEPAPKPTGPPASDADDLAFTIAEAVKKSKLSKATLYRRAKAGELRLVHIGTKTLIRREELENLLKRHETAAKAA